METVLDYLERRLTEKLGEPLRDPRNSPIWSCHLEGISIRVGVGVTAEGPVLRVLDAAGRGPVELRCIRFVHTPTREAVEEALRRLTADCEKTPR